MRKLKENVFWVGAKDWEVRGFHGNELSTHKGTTYNAYLIKDEKNVLIDTVEEPLTEILLERIKKHIDICDIDYIVVNHAEPDHSGALRAVMERCPNAKIIASEKGVESIQGHFHKEWDIQTVKTGDKINIGKNNLVFIEARMLHWPDSTFTYLEGENILFPNDAFGQHYSTSQIFNDEVDNAEVLQEALKYYANILTPFSKLVTRKIDELKSLNLPIDIIAPSHGIIWRDNPLQIVEKYYEWASGKVENSVVLIYNSMYGATKKMAEYIGLGLEEANVPYKIFNVNNTDLNDLLTEIFKVKGIICGSSTINNGPLVSLYPVLHEMKGLKFTGKVGATFGSYGWSGEAPQVLQSLLEEIKVDIIQESINFKYTPTEEELNKCVEFGKSFGEKMLES